MMQAHGPPNVRGNFRTLTPIPGCPNYGNIKNMKKEILQNVKTVFTTNGNSTDGCHHVLCTLNDYNIMIAPSVWNDQGPPAVLGQWAVGANQAQIASNTANFDIQCCEHTIHKAAVAACNADIMGAINDACYGALRDPVQGYSQVPTDQILSHLTDNYGTMTEEDMLAITKELHQPFDPTRKPMEQLFIQG
jgi:hypothetical protein